MLNRQILRTSVWLLFRLSGERWVQLLDHINQLFQKKHILYILVLYGNHVFMIRLSVTNNRIKSYQITLSIILQHGMTINYTNNKNQESIIIIQKQIIQNRLG